MTLVDTEAEYSWLERSAARIAAVISKSGDSGKVKLLKVPDRVGYEITIGTIARIQDSGISLVLSPSGLDYRLDFGFWVVMPPTRNADTIAEMAECLFGQASTPDGESKSALPRDVLVRDYFRSNRRMLGVSTGFGPNPRHKIPLRFRRDVAYFSHTIAVLALGEQLLEPREYFKSSEPASYHWLGYGSPISQFNCPICSKRLKSYEVSCIYCDWNEPATPSSSGSIDPYDYELADT